MLAVTTDTLLNDPGMTAMMMIRLGWADADNDDTDVDVAAAADDDDDDDVDWW